MVVQDVSGFSTLCLSRHVPSLAVPTSRGSSHQIHVLAHGSDVPVHSSDVCSDATGSKESKDAEGVSGAKTSRSKCWRVYVCVYLCVCVYVYVRTCVYMCGRMYECVCMWYMCVCTDTCACVFRRSIPATNCHPNGVECVLIACLQLTMT
jgi:hypothetical protein